MLKTIARVISLFLLMANSACISEGARTPSPGDEIAELRADRIILLRNVAKEPFFGLEVHLDGLVIKFTYPEGRGNVQSLYLTENERVLVKSFVEVFCQEELPTSEDSEDEYYDLAVKCSDGGFGLNEYGIKQSVFAENKSSEILAILLDKFE